MVYNLLNCEIDESNKNNKVGHNDPVFFYG